jgi:pfkB family carbohydrate kinase.
VGCGDAFIAAFLATLWHGADLIEAVEAGKMAGAAATAWRRPLPDGAYGAPS